MVGEYRDRVHDRLDAVDVPVTAEMRLGNAGRQLVGATSRRVVIVMIRCGLGASPGMGTVAAWGVAHPATSVFLVALGDRCSVSPSREPEHQPGAYVDE